MPTKPDTFETHRRPITDHARNLTRPAFKRLYDSAQWKAMRQIVLNEQPFCAACLREPSNHVDHIVGLDIRPDLAFDRHNLQGLCPHCHSQKTIKEGVNWTPIIGRYVITGAPNSGKTTWVKANSKPGDFMWDYDAIATAMFNMPKYPRPPYVADAIMGIYDNLIDSFIKRGDGRCFIIIANSIDAIENARMIKAALVIMPQDRDRVLLAQ